MPLWAVKPLLIALLCAGLIAAAAGYRAHVYRQGYNAAKAECKAADQSARIAQLERELAQAIAAESIGQQTRERIVIEVGRIELQTEQSLEVVRGAWDRPACALPERVRAEIQDRINETNAAAR